MLRPWGGSLALLAKTRGVLEPALPALRVPSQWGVRGHHTGAAGGHGGRIYAVEIGSFLSRPHVTGEY